jgi:hypothetical protein
MCTDGAKLPDFALASRGAGTSSSSPGQAFSVAALISHLNTHSIAPQRDIVSAESSQTFWLGY